MRTTTTSTAGWVHHCYIYTYLRTHMYILYCYCCSTTLLLRAHRPAVIDCCCMLVGWLVAGACGRQHAATGHHSPVPRSNSVLGFQRRMMFLPEGKTALQQQLAASLSRAPASAPIPPRHSTSRRPRPRPRRTAGGKQRRDLNYGLADDDRNITKVAAWP